MSRITAWLLVYLLLLTCAVSVLAQQPAATASSSSAVVVPPLVNFSGVLTDVNGKPLTGVVGVTFALYQESQGGAPLWLETQNVYPDKTGHYTVMLGSSSSSGIPSQIFSAAEARWLGVQPQGQPEQPRVSLLSVPYALKAADAQTVGGLPASAFVLAAPGGGVAPNGASSDTSTAGPAPNVAGTGTTDFIPIWTNSTTLGSSVLYQSGTGSTAKVGINTTAPTQTLEVDSGNAMVKGLKNFKTTGDRAFLYVGDTNHALEALYGSGLLIGAYKVPQALFIQDKTGRLGIGTTTPAYTLDVNGTGNFTGLVNFASGQTFPGTGTITGVTAGTDLTGGGTSGTVTLNVDTTKVVTGVTAGTALTGGGTGGVLTLNLDTTKVPLLAASNTFTQPQTISVTGTGLIVSGTVYGVSSTAPLIGVTGSATIGLGSGVKGSASSTLSNGVYGSSSGSNSNGVYGKALGASSNGVDGEAAGAGSYGVFGFEDNTSSGVGVGGSAHDCCSGVYGVGGIGVEGSGSIRAGVFSGDVGVSGNLYVGGLKAFRIDHPLDPANKYLTHAAVESSEVMNIYTGNVVLDGNGEAWVTMPTYFQVLNRDFRYQLTAIGTPGPNLYVAQEIENNRFKIAGGMPGAKVSWQVTGLRQDAYVRAHPMIVEEDKPADERGKYISPLEHGMPEAMGIDASRRAKMHLPQLPTPSQRTALPKLSK